MVHHRSISLPECGPTEYSATEPYLFYFPILLKNPESIRNLSTNKMIRSEFETFCVVHDLMNWKIQNIHWRNQNEYDFRRIHVERGDDNQTYCTCPLVWWLYSLSWWVYCGAPNKVQLCIPLPLRMWTFLQLWKIDL